tara:strand:+ start:798 stop:1508 length:711 start_codon:yes stop_codon:yes gene_type:complete
MKKIKKWLYGEIGGGEGLFYKMVWEGIFISKRLLNLHNRLMAGGRIKKYFKTNNIIKVQLGCGNDILNGFLNTDLLGEIPIDITKKLPFPNNSVNLIYSNHTVEHIYHKQFKHFLKESHRVLKPGGIHIILTPSIEKLTKSVYHDPLAKKKIMEIHTHKGEEVDSATLINRITHMRYMHKFLYDFECINRLAKKYKYHRVILVNDLNLIPDTVIKQNIKDKCVEGDGITETFVLVK